MNKKIIGGIAILSIAALAAFNVRIGTQSKNLSSLALANIEALAQNEGGNGNDCTIIEYSERWLDGCLYYCARCAEGHYQILYLIHCVAR